MENKLSAVYGDELFKEIQSDLISFAENVEENMFANKGVAFKGIINQSSTLPIGYKAVDCPEGVRLNYELDIAGVPIGILNWSETDLQSTKEDIVKTSSVIIDSLRTLFAHKVIDTGEILSHLRMGTANSFMESIGFKTNIRIESPIAFKVDISRKADKLDFALIISDGEGMFSKAFPDVYSHIAFYIRPFIINSIVSGRYKDGATFEI